MSELLIFLGLGLLLISVLAFMLCRTEPETDDARYQVRRGRVLVPSALDEQQGQLLERIFGDEDWNFLRSRVPDEVQQSFLKERREMAFCWLELIRKRAREAMHCHLVNARNFRTIEPVLELRIAMNYFAFEFSCVLLTAVLWLRGPVALRMGVRRADQLCERLRGLAEVPGGGKVSVTRLAS